MLKNKNIFFENEKNVASYFKDIKNCAPLSREEEYELWYRYKTKNDMWAKNKLISSNLRFVANEAKKYQGMGLSYSDLIAEGNMGLIKGIEKFDGSKGYKIISYSVWWIKQSIIEAIKKRNTLNGENLPTDHEEKTTLDESDDANFLSFNEEKNIEPYTYKEDTDTKELEMKKTISLLMGNLTDREKFIISEYYGLNSEKTKTLEEIGKSLNLTKERIRQIHEVAMRKLRTNSMNLEINQDIYR